MLASCEFSGKLLVLPGSVTRVAGILDLNSRNASGDSTGQSRDAGLTSMPQDVRLTDDGRTFVVADMMRGGVWLVDARTWHVRRFLRTGAGAHGVYPSRDGRRLYVTNRGEGTISVLSRAADRVVARWRLAAGASPDMGGVDPSGRYLWLSGRYSDVVYVISTRTGRTLHTVRVGSGPHGLAVWPQPGRYSLGHTGNMR
jgi:YVTN family beta-propeller protein